MKSKHVLITGASSGIGMELSRLFAKDGYPLVLAARNKEKLEKLAQELKQKHNVDSLVISKDLSLPSSPVEIFNEIKSKGIEVGILINNAGFGTFGKFWETDEKTEMDELQVNILALTHLTKLFLPDMVARSYGKVLNVASTAAFQPGPLMAVYYASKAYVLRFTEALNVELRGTGVYAGCLCPGPTETNFHITAGLEHSRLFSTQVMDVKEVAEAAYSGMKKNKPVIVPGIKNNLLRHTVQHLPTNIVARAVKFINEKIKK